MIHRLARVVLCLFAPFAVLGAQSVPAAIDSGSSPALSSPSSPLPLPRPLALVQRPLRERALPADLHERSAPPTLRERIAPRLIGDSLVRVPADTPSAGEVFGRIALAGGGAIAGGLGGGLLGYAVLYHGNCGCEDPGMTEFATGALVGIAAGAALAAAIPRQRSTCSYGRRALYGLVGALAGGALGVLPPHDQRVIFIPLGTTVGAGLASAYCG